MNNVKSKQKADSICTHEQCHDFKKSLTRTVPFKPLQINLDTEINLTTDMKDLYNKDPKTNKKQKTTQKNGSLLYLWTGSINITKMLTLFKGG